MVVGRAMSKYEAKMVRAACNTFLATGKQNYTAADAAPEQWKEEWEPVGAAAVSSYSGPTHKTCAVL